MVFEKRHDVVLLILCFLLFKSISYAGVPLWTFEPLTATSIAVPKNTTATIQYKVTNQSKKSKSLEMTPIIGITQTSTGVDACGNPFTLPSKGASCTLSLLVDGSALTHPITDGPIVCEQGSKLQCYMPSSSNSLNINVSGEDTYTIGGTVSGMSGNLILQNNGADNNTINSDGGFTFATAIEDGSSYNVTVLTQPTGQTCSVSNSSGVVTNNDITDVIVTCVSDDTTLSVSVSNLALSINDTGLNTALTGTPRIITITNSGGAPAMNVTYSASPALPSGTTISPSSCGTIPFSGECVLTITPGNTPSALSGDPSPTPIILSISGTRTNTLVPTINILTYGSVYQGGYVFAVDDYTDNTGSIGGSVVTLTDQIPRWPNGVMWSSNGQSSISLSRDIIPGISEISTTSSPEPTYAAAQSSFDVTYSNTNIYPFPSSGNFFSCAGGTDGACNSANILTFYNTYITNYNIGASPYTLSPGPTTSSYYPAGICTDTINGYSDWYLPAICEMGGNGAGCSSDTQNISNQLPDLIGLPSAVDPGTSCTYGSNCLAGYYWSSTSDSSGNNVRSWSELFNSGLNSNVELFKNGKLGVRCTRHLTN